VFTVSCNIEQEFIMSTNQYVGKCSGKSYYDGDQVGTEFVTENISFAMNFFSASKGQDFVHTTYGKNLDAGNHELVVGPEKDARLEYKVGVRTRSLEGTVKVTVSSDLAEQVGTFDATYFDDIGRLILFKGEYNGKYSVV
jgi:hypothetical protein